MRNIFHNILAGVLLFAGVVLLFNFVDWVAAQPFTAPIIFVVLIGGCLYALYRIGKSVNR